MSTACLTTDTITIGSTNDVKAEAFLPDGTPVTSGDLTYQLQPLSEPKPLPPGDPAILEEGPMPYDAGNLIYRGTLAKATTSQLTEDQTYYLFILASFLDASETLRRAQPQAIYKEG